jgi:alkylation response protein AidB-like acyl-CoA dehydrogenase
MPIYNAPLADMKFILNDVFNADQFWQSNENLAHVDSATAEAILEEMAKFAQNVTLPLNRTGDEEGATFSNGAVTTPAGFKEAFKQYAEGGWIGLAADEEWGGQGMPKMLTVLADEMLFATNPSFMLYPLLSVGAGMALNSYASQEQKETYLPKIYSGEWSGTMCLTEPHAGTDLGIIKTKAERNEDGTYNITGTKIFITGGDHDLAENIIHLVLAKTPDAPAGSRGISLFIVPKFLVNADGSVGERNAAGPGSIEHKMGIKASATCVMNFDGAKGYLVGKENEGLAAMFVMMNYERLSMGIQGLGASEFAYQNAAQYATETGSESAKHGVQVFGGHGFISEHGMEQIVRDTRIACLYEGTTEIQALDLLGRKVLGTQGAMLKDFTKIIHKFVEANKDNAAMKEFVEPLAALNKEWGDLTMQIGMKAMQNPDEVGAAAVDYLYFSGYVTLAYLWARMALVAQETLAAGTTDVDFYNAKVTTARFYFKKILPRVRSHVDVIAGGVEPLLALDAEHFSF